MRSPYGFATRLMADPLGEALSALMAETDEQRALIGSRNQVEAVRANLENRAPRFADPAA